MKIIKTNNKVYSFLDTDELKTIYVGGALCTGHFSQQEKSWYYLRKELKKKFIQV